MGGVSPIKPIKPAKLGRLMVEFRAPGVGLDRVGFTSLRLVADEDGDRLYTKDHETQRVATLLASRPRDGLWSVVGERHEEFDSVEVRIV